jgi:hypothetical protein
MPPPLARNSSESAAKEPGNGDPGAMLHRMGRRLPVGEKEERHFALGFSINLDI